MLVNGCGGGAATGGGVAPALDCPLPFYSALAPTLRASDIVMLPTQMLTPTTFISTTSGGVVTTNVIAGDHVYVASALEPLTGTIATLAGGPPNYTGTITPFVGPPTSLNMTDTALGATVPSPLVFSNFGLSKITDDMTGLPNSVFTYTAFAGGMLPTTTLPTTGTSLFTGKMTGIVAETTHANPTDTMNGNATLTVNFASGAVTGTLSGITMAGGSGTFNNVTLIGTISGTGFSGTATTSAAGTSSLSMPTSETGTAVGNFYVTTANEVTGTITITSASGAQILIASFGASTGGTGYTGKECPTGPFYTNFAPTLQVSTQPTIPTFLQTAVSFNSTTNGSSGTATVTTGPSGVFGDSIFTLANPFPGDDTLVNAVATLPSSMLLASGPPALTMTATSLASLAGLTHSDFGMWAITNPISPTSPPVAFMTYSAYAGGTLLTSTMPTTGTATYTGKMVGVLADAPLGGGDDVAGDVTLSIDFAALTITGSVSNITTTSGPSSLLFPIYTTGTITFTGSIATNSFSATATAAAIVPTATIMTMNGNFYGLLGIEAAGTFTVSVPTQTQGRYLIGSFGAK